MILTNSQQTSKLYAIGIDIGGTSLKCGVATESGEILASFIVPLENAKTESKIINVITHSITQCVEQVNGQILGIGIGFPGIIDDDTIIGGADNLPHFVQPKLGQTLKEITGYNVTIDNDANLMGLGELIYGSAKNCSDAIFLTVGTGIGGAIMINKQLFSGYKNRGAELGHIIIKQDGLKCPCGSRGCLETYASITALIDYYKTQNKFVTEEIDGKYIIEKYHLGEKHAIKAMEHHFDYLAAGIASFLNIFSPQKIIIGGGISESGQFYIDELNRRVQSLTIPIAYSNSKIVAATLGNKAGILGCCAKVFQTFKH